MTPLPPPPEGAPWPPGIRWAWRPEPWSGASPAAAAAPEPGTQIAPAVKLYHEGPAGAVQLAPLQPAGLALTVGRSAGGYASLAVDLPRACYPAIDPRSIVRLAMRGALSGPGRLHGRINLRHGAEVSEQTRPAEIASGTMEVAFDLAYLDLGGGVIDQIWIDLMIYDPAHTRLELHDLTLCSHPRAEF